MLEHCPDEMERAHRRNLPGEEKYTCMECECKFLIDELYTAVNGDVCCLKCYEDLTEEQQQRFE